MSIAGWGGISLSGSSSSPSGGDLELRAVAPTDGDTIEASDAIYFEVASSASITTLVVIVETPSSSISEVALAGGFLTTYFSNDSSEVATLGDGFSVQILRTGGWTDTSLNVRIFAADDSGDSLAETLSWTVEQAATVTPVATVPSAASTAAAADPLGFGIIRPFMRVPTNDFATASGEALVRAAVGQVLGTTRGDIPWRPSFGTTLATLRHMRNTAALPELARISIQQALQQWEPRITITQLTAAPATGANVNKILLSLHYRINNSPESAIRVLL